MPFWPTIYPSKKEGIQPYAKVLYLSPILEKRAWSAVVGVVAHELAHIVLRHPVEGVDPKTYNDNEKAAWLKVEEWGFVAQSRRCQAIHKWRESYDKYRIQKLKDNSG